MLCLKNLLSSSSSAQEWAMNCIFHHGNSKPTDSTSGLLHISNHKMYYYMPTHIYIIYYIQHILQYIANNTKCNTCMLSKKQQHSFRFMWNIHYVILCIFWFVCFSCWFVVFILKREICAKLWFIKQKELNK